MSEFDFHTEKLFKCIHLSGVESLEDQQEGRLVGSPLKMQNPFDLVESPYKFSCIYINQNAFNEEEAHFYENHNA